MDSNLHRSDVFIPSTLRNSAVVCAVIMLGLAILMEKLTAKKLIAANQLSSAASLSYQSNLRNAEAIHGMGMEASIRKKTVSYIYQLV